MDDRLRAAEDALLAAGYRPDPRPPTPLEAFGIKAVRAYEETAATSADFAERVTLSVTAASEWINAMPPRFSFRQSVLRRLMRTKYGCTAILLALRRRG